MPTDIHSEGSHPQNPSEPQPAAAASWVESLFELIISRIALFQLEAKQVAIRNIGRAVMIASGAFAAVVAWLLLMAAVTGIVHAYAGFAWYWTCLVIAGIHLLALFALFRCARAPGPPLFEHTRSEFHKDREWMQNLQHRKSKI